MHAQLVKLTKSIERERHEHVKSETRLNLSLSLVSLSPCLSNPLPFPFPDLFHLRRLTQHGRSHVSLEIVRPRLLPQHTLRFRSTLSLDSAHTRALRKLCNPHSQDCACHSCHFRRLLEAGSQEGLAAL